MKKIYSLLFLFFFFTLQAQIINIPDPNFKAKLLSANLTNNVAQDENGNSIIIDQNGDGEIQMEEASQVYLLDVVNSNIDDLTGINFFVNLTFLSTSYNNISILDLTNLSNLDYINCDHNNLSSLTITGVSNLRHLQCNFNNLESLDVTSLPNLEYLFCTNNQISTLDLLNSINLKTVFCDENNITELDFSNCPNLDGLACDSLSYINLKNGSNIITMSNMMLFENCFYCVDPEDLNGFNFENLPESSQISVYCSAYNGANYNTIKGTVYFDENNNGNCNSELIEDSFVKVKVSDGISDFYSFTKSGDYEVYTQEGEFTVTTQLLENSEFFFITPTTSVVNFSEANNSVEIRDFCLVPVGESNDVEIIISPLEPARPGFDATYSVFYRNKGNQTVSGAISFEFFGEKMDFVSSDVLPDAESENALTFDFQNLVPFESREIILTFNINAPTDTPPVNIGDWLSFKTEIEIADDVYLPDNEFTLRQEVVGSYDPNDILCLEGESVDPEMIGKELHYRIRFENTGNFPAERVVVAMPINPEDYEVSSFQLLNTSHEVQARVVDNTAEFFFEEIDLGPNEEGDILFSIKSLESLQIGDSVMSYADIYFDYNYPITTNEAVTTFEIMRTKEVELSSVSIFPNPATTQFMIQSDYKINSVEIYDVAGRLIQVSKLNSNQSSQNISQLPKGMYILKIQTEKGLVSYKLIKK